MDEPIVAVLFENEQHHPLFATSNTDHEELTGSHAAGDESLFSVTFENSFAPGPLFASPWVLHPRASGIADRRPRVTRVLVRAKTLRSGGLVDLPNDMSYERLARSSGQRTLA
jgi:hypothetical protein